MIKLTVMVHRKPGMSREEFSERWLNGHGPLVKRISGAVRMKKYVQTHYLYAPDIEAWLSERGWLPRCDGVTEAWWDSLDDMRAGISSPEGIAANAEAAEDEAKFCDMERTEAFMSIEHEIFDHTKG